MKEMRFIFNRFHIKSLIFHNNFDIKAKPQRYTLNIILNMEYKKESNILILHQRIVINEKDAPFSIDLTGLGIFEFENNIESTNIDELVQVNCAAIMFPFMREVVADIVRRSGLAPLLLPPTNFVARYADYKEKQKIESSQGDRKSKDLCTIKDKPKKSRMKKSL